MSGQIVVELNSVNCHHTKGWLFSLGQMFNHSLAWKKANFLKTNGDDDDDFCWYLHICLGIIWTRLWFVLELVKNCLLTSVLDPRSMPSFWKLVILDDKHIICYITSRCEIKSSSSSLPSQQQSSQAPQSVPPSSRHLCQYNHHRHYHRQCQHRTSVEEPKNCQGRRDANCHL